MLTPTPMTLHGPTYNASFPRITPEAIASAVNAAIASAITASRSDVANILDFGGGIGGDDAAAMRAAIASGRKLIMVPPGTYNCKSTATTYGSATDPSCFELRGLSDTFIIAYGATFAVDNSISSPTPVTTLSFTQNCRNVGILGGAFVGNNTGLSYGQENVGINFDSVTGLVVRDVKFTGSFNSAFAGVYGFDCLFENVSSYNTLTALDISHIENLIISRCKFFAANGGVTGLSLHYDTPTLGDNDVTTENGGSRTLVGSTSNHIKVLDSLFDGFGNGIAIDYGTGMLISRSVIRNGLVTTSANTQDGILIYQGSAAVSAGLKTTDITIENCDIYGNGTTSGAGSGTGQSGGIRLDTSGGTITGVNILGNRIYDNTASAVTVGSATNLSHVIVAGNDFNSRSGGGLQSQNIHSYLGTALWAGAGFARNNSDLSPVGVDDLHIVANNVAVKWLDASGASRTILSVTSSNVTYLRPASSAANIDLQDYAGNSHLRVDNLGNIIVNASASAALAAGATNGFFYVPTIAAPPTGSPGTVVSGALPACFDTTNNKLWVNIGGTTWKGVVLS